MNRMRLSGFAWARCAHPAWLPYFLFFASLCAHASPCAGVDRTLIDDRKAQLAPIIANQLNIKSVEVLQSYRYRGWYIIYVATPVSDEEFLFYNGEPSLHKYITAWSGAAKMDEGAEIERWVVQHAAGIPQELASCFAYHVTRARDQ